MVLEHEFNRIVNRKCIQRIMRKYNIICLIRKVNPYHRMMKATSEHTAVPNILNREFKQCLVGKVLLTYVTCNRAYLSTIKDAMTNEVLSYHVSNNIDRLIAIETAKKLVKTHKKYLIKMFLFIQIKVFMILVSNSKRRLK